MTRRGPCVFKGSFLDYKNMMSSIATLGGDALLVSGVRERSLEQSKCAERFGHRPSEFYPFVVPPSKQMTPGMYQRMKEHDAIGQERYSTPFIADIEQNLAFRARNSSSLLSSRTESWSFSKLQRKRTTRTSPS